MHLTQPGISKHIKQMEEYYGVPLFDRLGKKVALTQAGEILFEATQEVMASITAAEQRIEELKGVARRQTRARGQLPHWDLCAARHPGGVPETPPRRWR